ncbi:MAG TPA: tagaturonate epimerase family protein [Acidobacteriaceae bacterium]
MPETSLSRFSIGVGDRFAHQARAQLQACIQAFQAGVLVMPVWNKSNREHTIIGSEPAQTRAAADTAVKELDWGQPYFCDADHISLKTVDRFLEPCDFFTIDVADQIGVAASRAEMEAFIRRHADLVGWIELPGIAEPLRVTHEDLERVSQKYLAAASQATETYRHIERAKGRGKFLTEVSMDETDVPQTPAELLLILAALADRGVPLVTVAPKFTGRFNKGVDYVGDAAVFARELEEDMAVVRYAVSAFGLPAELKLSLHSGSDKFSIYGAVHNAMTKMNAGLHLKTAGTTWLEEMIGLAEAGGDALALVKDIYVEAYADREELCAPYAAVIDIEVARLPLPEVAQRWTAEQWVGALRHDLQSPEYNSSLRQLMHVGFKIAAKMGSRYTAMLERHEGVVAENVTRNLLDRHIRPVFLGAGAPSATNRREAARR